MTELQKVAERYPAYRFSLLLKIVLRWGRTWNHKRIYRIFYELKLNINKRRKGKCACQIVTQSR